jgi:hypothetical protein
VDQPRTDRLIPDTAGTPLTGLRTGRYDRPLVSGMEAAVVNRVCALALLLFVLLGGQAAAAPLPNGGLDGSEDFVQLASDGFRQGVDGPHREGSSSNTYAWSGAWFRGKFYVGTGRNLNCLRSSRGQRGCPENGLPAPDDRAEIWAYTPAGVGGVEGTWKRVHQAPVLNVFGAGAFPRDVGYRGMTVCNPGGQARLWVATLGVGGRVLWTRDGKTFADASSVGLHNSLGELFAGTADLGFRTLVCWKGRLLAAPVGAPGDGDLAVNPVVFANADPANPASPWDVAVDTAMEPGIGDPNNAGVFSMAASGGALYIGITNLITGFEIWKGTGCAAPPSPCEFQWERIVDNGAGRPRAPLTKIDNGGVLDVAPFRGSVYFGVASSSFFNGTSAEIVRVNPDDTFDLVMGAPRSRAAMPANFNCRRDPDAPASCVPLSGIGPGFGEGAGYEPGSAGYVWRLRAFAGNLYAGLASEAAPLMRTSNGENWYAIAPAGFAAQGVAAVRTLVAAPNWPGGPALVFGTVGSSSGGAQVWVGTCAPEASPVAAIESGLPDAGAEHGAVKLAVADELGQARVTLDASASTDPNCGRIKAFEWYMGDMVGRSLAGAQPLVRGPIADLKLDAGEDYRDHILTLRVVDDRGFEDRGTITIRASRNAPPTVEAGTDPPASLIERRIRLNLYDLDGDGVERLTVNGTCADPENELVSCRWTSRGGITIASPDSATSTAIISLESDRSSTVSLIATDDHGYQTVSSISVRLRRPDHDVAVEGVALAPAVAGLPQAVTITMRNDGHFEETVSVGLADRTGGFVGPASRTITLAPGTAGDVTFTWIPEDPGVHTLFVTADPVDGERIVKDNERGLLVEVRPP